MASGGQRPVAGNGVGARAGVQQLDADMVRAGVEEFGELRGRLAGVAVRDEGVDQRVAAIPGQVLVGPAEAAQVSGVVHQAQVGLPHAGPADRPSGVRVGFEHGLVLDREHRASPKHLPGPLGIGRGNEVGMRACGTFRREPQHLRAQGRQHDALARHAVGEQRIQIVGHRVVRPGVLLDRFRVTGTDAQQEPAGVTGLDSGERRRHLVSVALPDVDDPGRHHQLVGSAQQCVDDHQIGPGRSAEPERVVAEALEFGRQVGRDHADRPPYPERPEQAAPILRHHASAQVPSAHRSRSSSVSRVSLIYC
jgi:hypothetical protein